MAHAMSGVFKTLTRKHGIKIQAPFPCSVEDVGLAVGDKVGHSSIKSAARMNSSVVIFLDRVEKAHSVVETGITVKSSFVQVLPLSQPSTKVVLSNVPPFITDEFLIKELSRHGKVVSPIRKILSGCKSPLMKHVVSHRRQLYMILNSGTEELNLRFRVKVDDYEYVIFTTTEVMKCFGCGEEGHTVRSCRARAEPPQPGPETTEAGAVPGQRAAPAWRSAPGAEGSQPGQPAAPGPAAASERPTPAPRGSPRRSAAVAEPEHRVSSVNAPGESVDVGESEECVMGGEGEVGGGNESVSEQVKGTDSEQGQTGEGGQAGEEQDSEVQEKSVLWSEQVEEAEMEEAVKEKTATKRRRRRSTHTEAKSSKVEEKQLSSGSSDSDCLSDSSDIPSLNSSQKKRTYSAEKLKLFLFKTKNQKVRVEDHFPDLPLFVSSARLHMSQRDESGLTDQEIFRLKKLVSKTNKTFNGNTNAGCLN